MQWSVLLAVAVWLWTRAMVFHTSCGPLSPWSVWWILILLASIPQDLKDFGREAGSVSFADIDRDVPGQG